jgi:hypothetical protein
MARQGLQPPPFPRRAPRPRRRRRRRGEEVTGEIARFLFCLI